MSTSETVRRWASDNDGNMWPDDRPLTSEFVLTDTYVLYTDFDRLQTERDSLRAQLAEAQRDLDIAHPAVRMALHRCEQQILAIEKSKSTPAHLHPTYYLKVLNQEADSLLAWMNRYEAAINAALAAERSKT